MNVKIIQTKDYVTKSNLPASDYVINPYVGCPHGCKYCYASFMKRFTNHTEEEWGTFIDVKQCNKRIDINKLKGKKVFLSSVTDCYNEFESEYKITRKILEELVKCDCFLSISTKSKLILRDIDLLKKISNVEVCLSINTLDESFKNDMDKASSIQDRLETLKELHENGIRTILFMSPMFPYITDFKKIIEESQSFFDEYWFENLNLRGSYKKDILTYIKNKYSKYYSDYLNIYLNNDLTYWENLGNEINDYCEKNNIRYKNYFYHSKLVQEKKNKNNLN